MEDRNPMDMLEELISNTELNKASIIDDYWDLFIEVSKGIKDNCIRQGYLLMKQIFHEDLSRSFTIYKELYYDSIYPEFQKFGEQVISKESNWRYEIKERASLAWNKAELINGFTREKTEKQDFGKVISAVYNVYDRVFYDI